LYFFVALIAIGAALIASVVLNEVKDFSRTMFITLETLACREIGVRGPSLHAA
jgi:hypothetical protein